MMEGAGIPHFISMSLWQSVSSLFILIENGKPEVFNGLTFAGAFFVFTEKRAEKRQNFRYKFRETILHLGPQTHDSHELPQGLAVGNKACSLPQKSVCSLHVPLHCT